MNKTQIILGLTTMFAVGLLMPVAMAYDEGTQSQAKYSYDTNFRSIYGLDVGLGINDNEETNGNILITEEEMLFESPYGDILVEVGHYQNSQYERNFLYLVVYRSTGLFTYETLCYDKVQFDDLPLTVLVEVRLTPYGQRTHISAAFYDMWDNEHLTTLSYVYWSYMSGCLQIDNTAEMYRDGGSMNNIYASVGVLDVYGMYGYPHYKPMDIYERNDAFNEISDYIEIERYDFLEEMFKETYADITFTQDGI